jgi:hypothetical protein
MKSIDQRQKLQVYHAYIEKEKDFSTILSSFNTVERFFSFEYIFFLPQISLFLKKRLKRERKI